MTERVVEKQTGSGDPRTLTTAQKLQVLGIFAIVLLIPHIPSLICRRVFVEWVDGFGRSKNDLFVFLIVPFLHYFLILSCPVVAGRISRKLAGFDVAWFRKSLSELVWIPALASIGLLAGIAASAVMRKLGVRIIDPRVFGSALFTNPEYLAAHIFLIAVAVPVCEEIFWRGYAQNCLGRVFGVPAGLFAQAFMFAMVHFQPVGGFFIFFLYGLIFGIWRLRRGTLVPIMMAHIAVNSLWCLHMANAGGINIKTDYVASFNETSKPAGYDPNDNAASCYQRACKLYAHRPRGLKGCDFRSWPSELAEEKQIELVKWLSANREGIEQLALGTEKPYYWPEYEGSHLMRVVVLNLHDASSLAKALCWRARLSAEKGNLEEAFSDSLVCYRLGVHLGGPKMMFEQLVGMALSRAATATAFAILDREKPSPELLKEVQEQYQESLSRQELEADFTTDKLVILDEIQRVFTDDGKGGGYIPRMAGERMENPGKYLEGLLPSVPFMKLNDRWVSLERRRTTRLVDRVFAYVETVSKKSPWELHSEGEDVYKVLDEMTEGNPFVDVLIPPVERMVNLSFRSKVHAEALITTLAALRYKKDKGKLPGTLEELVSTDYLEDVPIDPFSGKPLVYRERKGMFILYSFGADFDDDGGVRSRWGEGYEGGDQVFWPIGKDRNGADDGKTK
ncbi:MAG: CPBP family glutamic-type intramembrane protease [Planctomycetota bacterium]|jgi:membrane protease YdiL (CAAX protease family)